MNIKELNYLRIFNIKGIPVYLHWPASALLIILAMFAIPSKGLSIILGVSFLGLTLLHELGHAYLASRCGHHPSYITLSAFHGQCKYEIAYAVDPVYDKAVIAWGGILAQIMAFIPALFLFFTFGKTHYPALNIFLSVFVFYNGFLVLFNLLPVHGLDGENAWGLIAYRLKLTKIQNHKAGASKPRTQKRKKRNHFKVIK